MNREIKFRGQRTDTKEFVYGYYHEVEAEGVGYSYIFWQGNTIPVRADSVGQFTGLLDKNGKEIYEGDIYHMGDNTITYTVVWNDSGFIGKQNGSSSYAGLEYWMDRIEIIGNVYENKKLIN